MTSISVPSLNRGAVATLAATICVGFAALAASSADAASTSASCSRTAAPLVLATSCEVTVQCPTTSACKLVVTSTAKGLGLVRATAQPDAQPVKSCGPALLECTVTAEYGPRPPGSNGSGLCNAQAYLDTAGLPIPIAIPTALQLSLTCRAEMIPV